MRYQLALLKWQLPLCLLMSGFVALCIWTPCLLYIDVTALGQVSFIGWLTSIASILALFCSLSVAFVLFVTQSTHSERVATYDILKSRLLEAHQWLDSQPATQDRDLCMSLVFALDKLDMSDLPQTDWGPEYEQYTVALEASLKAESESQRTFFLESSIHVIYIEHLLSRIGLISIRQVITKSFLDALAKGVGVICIALLMLAVTILWFGAGTKPYLVVASTFCGVASIFLFYEFCLDLYKYYSDELDFIEDERGDEG